MPLLTLFHGEEERVTGPIDAAGGRILARCVLRDLAGRAGGVVCDK